MQANLSLVSNLKGQAMIVARHVSDKVRLESILLLSAKKKIWYDRSISVSPPGRNSRDSRSSHLAEATEKALGTIAL